jgi:hypothetical protein
MHRQILLFLASERLPGGHGEVSLNVFRKTETYLLYEEHWSRSCFSEVFTRGRRESLDLLEVDRRRREIGLAEQRGPGAL